MAAPSPTARGTPAGLPLRDGFGTMVTFGTTATLSIWEKSLTPPGKSNGDPIILTTFHSTRVTKYPRELIEDTDISGTCAYDPNVESDLESIVGTNMEVTITFNDGTTKACWGYLKEFTPSEHSDGEMPEATFTIVITNLDAAWATFAPVIANVAGT